MVHLAYSLEAKTYSCTGSNVSGEVITIGSSLDSDIRLVSANPRYPDSHMLFGKVGKRSVLILGVNMKAHLGKAGHEATVYGPAVIPLGPSDCGWMVFDDATLSFALLPNVGKRREMIKRFLVACTSVLKGRR